MIYLIFSSQSKMARSALATLLKTDYPKRDECNFVAFDMAVTPVNELARECGLLPLGYDKKAVVGENCAFLAKSKTKYKYAKDDGPDALLAYLNDPNPAIDLYLLLYSDDPDTKNPLFKAIEASGEVKQVKQLTPEQWPAYIKTYFEKRGSPIDSDAVRELYTRTGGDYASFINEAQKLLTYAEGEPVTLKLVAELVTPRLDDDVFHLSNALTRGDVDSAMRIYRDMKVHSVEEVSLIGILAGQFRFMDMVRFLDAKGLGSQEIAHQLGCSPIRADITVRNLYRIKEASLLKIMEQLYTLDYEILSGHQDPEFAFSLFLANFSL
jgi:DNA polymerase-3 subunit delta